ncbi:MAG: polysaccharide pyruvyl transferase family protein [Gloeotrichia echinulata IR180]
MKNNQTKNIIFFRINTQYENLGDLIINKTLLENLRKYGNLVINIKGVPEWFSQELHIKDDYKVCKYKIEFSILLLLFAFKYLFQANSKVYFVLTPGHHSDDTSNTPRLLHEFRLIANFLLLKIMGVRICRFGASIGPFSKVGQIREKWQSKLMYFYSVRDTKAKDYANQIEINKVELFPDLAWNMQVPYESNTLLKLDDQEYVIFSFREYYKDFDITNLYRNMLLTTLDEIVKTVCSKWQKKLVISYQVEFDYDLCRDISNKYKDECELIFIDKKIDSQSWYNLYSRSYMIFSNRLHVLIFAMVCGSIPVAVVDSLTHDKITGVFSDAGLMRLLINISNRNNGVEVLNEISADSNRIKKDIALYIEHQKQTIDTIFSHVMNGQSQ